MNFSVNTFCDVSDIIPPGAVLIAANGTPFVVQNGLTFCASPDAYTVSHPAVGFSEFTVAQLACFLVFHSIFKLNPILGFV